MAQNSTRFCTQCGAQNPFTQAFCSNCGTKLDSGAPADLPPQQSTSYSGQPYYSNPANPANPYSPGGQPSQYGGYQQQQQAGIPPYAQAQPGTGNNTTGVVATILGFLLLREIRSRVIGCAVSIIILLAILACALLANHP